MNVRDTALRIAVVFPQQVVRAIIIHKGGRVDRPAIADRAHQRLFTHRREWTARRFGSGYADALRAAALSDLEAGSEVQDVATAIRRRGNLGGPRPAEILDGPGRQRGEHFSQVLPVDEIGGMGGLNVDAIGVGGVGIEFALQLEHVRVREVVVEHRIAKGSGRSFFRSHGSGSGRDGHFRACTGRLGRGCFRGGLHAGGCWSAGRCGCAFRIWRSAPGQKDDSPQQYQPSQHPHHACTSFRSATVHRRRTIKRRHKPGSARYVSRKQENTIPCSSQPVSARPCR